ncbi:hypothetical protein Q5P01_002702 [Channa striata]|uniref:Uncharacterized protein n=1 Tax=Channa striata TaxID=64152 RepID=A0AA88NUR9_CHASR|nr:hypothetical protein Q5P01_002702 [Channa striata]
MNFGIFLSLLGAICPLLFEITISAEVNPNITTNPPASESSVENSTSSLAVGSSTVVQTTKALSTPVLITPLPDSTTTDIAVSAGYNGYSQSANFQKVPTSAHVSELVPYYQRAFSPFHYLQVTGYSNGSINNFLKLGFESTSVPNNTEIGKVLIKAAPTITAFVIDTNSIFLNDIQVSSGANHKISLITASCLVLLSWLLTNQQ